MIWPVAESVSAIVPLLPPALFTRRAAARVRSIARAVRGSMNAFGFECRLAPGAERVDLGVRLPPVQAATLGHTQEEGEPDVGKGRRLTTDPEWFRRLVSFVFLEYDADSSLRLPRPSIFLGLCSESGMNGGLGRARGHHQVRRLLLEFMGPDQFAACEEMLELCFKRLPRGGRIVVAGAMLGRSPQTARLSVSISTDRIGEYLSRLGWLHWDSEVSEVVRRLGSGHPPVAIDFDVGARIGPKVGVHFPSLGGLGIRRVLDEVVGLSLCTTAKKRAVLDWPGVSEVRLSRRGWPCRFERYLNHLKVTFVEGDIGEAKAYLGVAPGLFLIR